MSRTTRKRSHWSLIELFSKHPHSDKKEWSKPPAWFKRINTQKRRAAEKDALRHIKKEEEVEIPKFRKTDAWDWM